jgi:hypothetical protein
MSDFETRLTEALASGADEAPEADRLVAGARTRAKTRRRTRYAVVVGAAVAALVVPVGVLALGGDDSSPGDRVATDPTDDPPAEWHTVEHDGVLVDVPGEWVRLDTSSCDSQEVRFAPTDVDPCNYAEEGLAFFTSASYDPAVAPGDIVENPGPAKFGYVRAEDWVVSVQTVGPVDVRRILGSVREAGQEAPDLSGGFRTESYGGLSVEVPASWQRGGLSAWCLDKKVDGWVEDPETIVTMIACTPSTGYGVRFERGSSDGEAEITQHGGPEYREGTWAGIAIVPDDAGKPIGYVEVVTPTQALADVIGGSLRVD